MEELLNSEFGPEPKRDRHLRDSIENFRWGWFSSTMSSGSLAVVLYQTPHQFPGLRTLGKVVFIIDLILFCAFTVMMAIRFVLRPKAFVHSLHDKRESFYFGTFWVSLSLIIQNASQYAFPECGQWLVRTLEIVFWCYLSLVLTVAIQQYQALFVTQTFSISDMTPAWILPIYPLLVTGPLAANLISHQPPSASTRIWVAGVLAQGLGWMVTIFMYVLWAIRLLCDELPDPSFRPGMYIAVGPTGKAHPAFHDGCIVKGLLNRIYGSGTHHAGRHSIERSPKGFLRDCYTVGVGYHQSRSWYRWHVPVATWVLVFLHHVLVHSPEVQRHVLQCLLVGFHFPECRSHIGHDTDWKDTG